MHRAMGCGEGVKEKEGSVVFCMHEIDRFLSEHVGQVAVEFDLLSILFDRFGVAWLIILLGMVKITSRTGPQAVKVIEPPSSRIKFIRVSQVPLSDQPSSVPELLETVRQSDLFEVHAVGRGRGIGLMPKALLIKPGHQTGS